MLTVMKSRQRNLAKKRSSFTRKISGRVSKEMEKEFLELTQEMGINTSLGLRFAMHVFFQWVENKVKHIKTFKASATAKDIMLVYNESRFNYAFADLRFIVDKMTPDEKLDFVMHAEAIRSGKEKLTKQEELQLKRLHFF